MRKSILILFLLPFVCQSQLFYNTDDYFSIANPSAFAEKKMYTTGVFSLNNLYASNTHYSYAIYKQTIPKTRFSVGINGDFQNFGILKSTRGAMQLAYSWRLTRKLSLNSGLGINATKDNFRYSESVYPIKFSNWNPAYVGIDAGVTMLSRKWKVGFSVINLNQGKRIIDTIKTKADAYFTFLGSYDFKLDSVGRFHLVPSLIIEYSPNGFISTYFNLKFNFSKHYAFYDRHSVGFGFTRSNPSLFYEYRFGNGITIGASVGRYLSKFYFANNFWNGMLRLNYTLNGSRRNYHVAPNF